MDTGTGQLASPVALLIELPDGRVYRHHINHIRSRVDAVEENTSLMAVLIAIY